MTIKINTINFDNTSSHIDDIKLNKHFKYKIWNNSMILKLINNEFPELLNYYLKLILIKSRENFAKYLILYVKGGLYINWNVLIYFKQNKQIKQHVKGINEKAKESELLLYEYDEQFDILNDFYDMTYNKLYDDNIIYSKIKRNEIIFWILSGIDVKRIPQNEYQNKLCLGNVYLTNKIKSYERNNKFVKIATSKYNFFKCCELDYSIQEFINPDLKLKSWNWLYKIKKYLSNILIFLIFKNKNWIMTFSSIIIMSCIEYFSMKYLQNYFNYMPKIAIVDNITLFSNKNKKFRIFKELEKNWKIISEEANKIELYAPKLNISRTIYDWKDSEEYVQTIKNKYGWINGWADNKNKYGNSKWFNYGLLYYSNKFEENIKMCPRTMELLEKIKSYINICGFSLMTSGCIIEPHTDDTGIKYNSLALHLGLNIPEPNETCKLVIKNNKNEYTNIIESNGKMFIFDASYEHYAMNQSTNNRLILYIDFKY
jgi:hypothetical protein